MTPVCPSSSFLENQEEHPNLQLFIFSSSFEASSSALPFATCFTTQHDQRAAQHDHKAEKSIESAGGSISPPKSAVVSGINDEPREDHQELEDQRKLLEDNSAKYWMSSKMRLMQKMMIDTNKRAAANSDHKPASNARLLQNSGNQRYGKWETRSCSSHNHGVRVCSDCNTTTTPLWRSGPQGPKSLCNACGIRQRKARRAMAEAANCSVVAVAPEKQKKEKKCRTSGGGHEKSKCSKLTDNSSDSQSEGNVSLEKLSVSLSKSSSGFRRVFPRDEEEAAILLMELSCGLLHTC